MLEETRMEGYRQFNNDSSYRKIEAWQNVYTFSSRQIAWNLFEMLNSLQKQINTCGRCVQ